MIHAQLKVKLTWMHFAFFFFFSFLCRRRLHFVVTDSIRRKCNHDPPRTDKHTRALTHRRARIVFGEDKARGRTSGSLQSRCSCGLSNWEENKKDLNMFRTPAASLALIITVDYTFSIWYILPSDLFIVFSPLMSPCWDIMCSVFGKCLPCSARHSDSEKKWRVDFFHFRGVSLTGKYKS